MGIVKTERRSLGEREAGVKTFPLSKNCGEEFVSGVSGKWVSELLISIFGIPATVEAGVSEEEEEEGGVEGGEGSRMLGSEGKV